MTNFKDLLKTFRKRYDSFTVEPKRLQQERLLSEEELFGDLQEHGKGDRLLGRFSSEDIRQALLSTGALAELARRGYPAPRIVIRSIDPFRQCVRLLTSEADPEDDEHLLCDLRVFDSWLHAKSPITEKPLAIDAFVIDWLLFQDPRAQFTPERPRLPGQRFPGLGVMRPCMRAILKMAAEVGKEAVVSIPEYYHNAILYRPEFRFFDPEIEGRFRVLHDFLSCLVLSDASGAVATEQIRDDAAGQTFVWKPHEQMLPMSARIREYFESDEYNRSVEAAVEANHFSWQKN